MSKKIYTLIGKQINRRKEVVKNRQAVKGVLADCLSGEKPIYINLLMAAYDENIIAAILNNDILDTKLLTSLQRKMISNHGTNEYCAYWAISTWFLAFEKQIPQDMLNNLDDTKVLHQEMCTQEKVRTGGFLQKIKEIFRSHSNQEPINHPSEKKQLHFKKVCSSQSPISSNHDNRQDVHSFPSNQTVLSVNQSSNNIKEQLQVAFNNNFKNSLLAFQNRHESWDEDNMIAFYNDSDVFYKNASDKWYITCEHYNGYQFTEYGYCKKTNTTFFNLQRKIYRRSSNSCQSR